MAPKSLEKSCSVYSDIWSSRNLLKPEQVALGSDKKYWFDCHICNHSYEQSPNNKSNNRGCPYCANSILCGSIDCNFCLPKSCYIYSKMWSSKNDLRPEEVALGTNKKYWFDCHICNHSYEQSPTKKTSLCNGCPYCSGHKICGLVDCKFCLIKSCYIYSESWSSKNKLNPEEVAISSSIKVRFNCKVCNHDYVQKPSDKTNKSTKCPYCANKKLCGDLKCTFCLLKTCYIYGEIWSSKNLMHPEEVAISSHKKYWFYCKKCKQDYEQNPRNKTNNKQSCPRCVNKTERIVDDYFKDYEIEFNTQLKINSSKRYDFCLPKYKLIIEIDGDQHFKQVSNWGCYKKTLESDIQKMKVALDNGYSVLRIYQPDIFNERLNWRQTILDNMYIRTKPDITCVSSNPEIYNNHINLKE